MKSLIFLLLLCSVQVSVIATDPGYINVLDFGAIPNDNKCDADAIEAAVQAAKRLMLRPKNGSYLGVSRGIYFPSGVYHLSRTISCHNQTALFSNNGKAVIMALNKPGLPPVEVFFRFATYTNSIQNLKFVGGKTQLLFSNPNTNQTTIEITNCEFQHATDTAIRAIPDAPANHLSAILTIRNCKFLANYHCVESYCDYTVIADCWVEVGQPQMADGPVFINRAGHLFFDRMIGVPCADASKGIKNLENCRWVDNYGSFTALNSRFGAEGAGIPVVYQYKPFNIFYPHVFCGGTINIQGSYVFTGSQRRKNACVIMLYALPQLVVFRDNIGPVNNVLFRYAEGFDPSPTLKELEKSRSVNLINYVIGYNLTYPVSLEKTVPKELDPLIRVSSER